MKQTGIQPYLPSFTKPVLKANIQDMTFIADCLNTISPKETTQICTPEMLRKNMPDVFTNSGKLTKKGKTALIEVIEEYSGLSLKGRCGRKVASKVIIRDFLNKMVENKIAENKLKKELCVFC